MYLFGAYLFSRFIFNLQKNRNSVMFVDYEVLAPEMTDCRDVLLTKYQFENPVGGDLQLWSCSGIYIELICSFHDVCHKMSFQPQP